MKDFSNQINGRLLDMKKENQKMRREHEQMVQQLNCKVDKEVIGQKMGKIYKDLSELRDMYGIGSSVRNTQKKNVQDE